MPNVKLYNMSAAEVGTLELNEDLFGMDYNEALIHQAVVTRLANERQGTKSTLTRAEVRGGGAKPWRQKGTGRARQGSIRSPQWTKGGVVFAPKSRDFSKKMNVTAKRIALFSSALAEDQGRRSGLYRRSEKSPRPRPRKSLKCSMRSSSKRAC